MFLHAPLSTTSCGTPPAPNIARLLLGALPLRWPGRLSPRVRNATLERAALPDPLVREVRAVVDGVSTEAIVWGTALGASRLGACVQRLVPEIALPWAAYQTFCALSQARRGDALRAVLSLPLETLAPQALLTALSDAVASVLPDSMPDVSRSQDMLLGLACFAMLYELTRCHPVEAVRTPAGHALLRCLRVLGRTLAVVSRLQQIGNAAGVEGNGRFGLFPMAEAGAVPPAPPLAMAQGPLRSVPLEAGVSADSPGKPAEMIPLAAARTGKGQASRAQNPSPPKKSGVKAVAARKPPLQRRRAMSDLHLSNLAAGSGRMVMRGGVPGTGPAGSVMSRHGGADGIGAGEANKEVMFSVLPGRVVDRKSPTANDRAKTAPEGNRDSGSRHSAPRPGVRVKAAEAPGASPPAAGPPPAPPSRLLPACTRFYNLRTALEQVGRERLEPGQRRFCTHDRARPIFEDTFTITPPVTAPLHGWMAALPVHERFDNPLRNASLFKYAGPTQREECPLGEDDVYAVATLSVLTDHELRHYNIGAAHILEFGSFQRLDHVELDGNTQTLLAYAVPRCGPGNQRAEMGLLPIERNGTSYRLYDPHSGWALQGPLDALLAGITHVSGWPQRAPGQVQADSSRGPMAAPALSLFVRAEDIRPGPACRPSRTDGAFLPSVHFYGGHRLLPNCFTVRGNHIVIADEAGVLRTLVFTRTNGTHVLNAQRGEGRDLIHRLGLRAGAPYRLADVVDQLVQKDLIEVHTLAEEQSPARTQTQPFHAHGVPAESETQTHATATPLSSFRMEGDQLHFVDHDGTEGTLVFVRDGLPPHTLRIAPGNDERARRFAAENDLLPHAFHTVEEIEWQLGAQGFVRVD